MSLETRFQEMSFSSFGDWVDLVEKTALNGPERSFGLSNTRLFCREVSRKAIRNAEETLVQAGVSQRETMRVVGYCSKAVEIAVETDIAVEKSKIKDEQGELEASEYILEVAEVNMASALGIIRSDLFAQGILHRKSVRMLKSPSFVLMKAALNLAARSIEQIKKESEAKKEDMKEMLVAENSVMRAIQVKCDTLFREGFVNTRELRDHCSEQIIKGEALMDELRLESLRLEMQIEVKQTVVDVLEMDPLIDATVLETEKQELEDYKRKKGESEDLMAEIDEDLTKMKNGLTLSVSDAELRKALERFNESLDEVGRINQRIQRELVEVEKDLKKALDLWSAIEQVKKNQILFPYVQSKTLTETVRDSVRRNKEQREAARDRELDSVEAENELLSNIQDLLQQVDLLRSKLKRLEIVQDTIVTDEDVVHKFKDLLVA